MQVIAAPGTYTPSTRYTILTANGGVIGTFAQLTTTSNLAFLTPSLSYDANDVFLGFAQTTAADLPVGRRHPQPACDGRRHAGAGPRQSDLQRGRRPDAAAGARQAFDALSGEIHASAVTAAFEDQRLPREAILDRLSQPAETPVLGRRDHDDRRLCGGPAVA